MAQIYVKGDVEVTPAALAHLQGLGVCPKPSPYNPGAYRSFTLPAEAMVRLTLIRGTPAQAAVLKK